MGVGKRHQRHHFARNMRVAWVGHYLLRVDAEPLGDGDEVFGSEATLSVDVHGLALAAALRRAQLARHTERVAELGLARAELAEDLVRRFGGRRGGQGRFCSNLSEQSLFVLAPR